MPFQRLKFLYRSRRSWAIAPDYQHGKVLPWTVSLLSVDVDASSVENWPHFQ
jgi:hypothetical protein